MHIRHAVLALVAASTSAAPGESLLPLAARADEVCASKDLVACSSALPSGFCCPKDSQCQSLAGGTTALCCPEGSNCDRIQPIACDVNLQDPKGNTDPTVVTSVFNVNLETCDNGCCPFGYSCAAKIAAATGKPSSSGQCIRNKDQSKKPGEDSDPKSTTTTTTTTTKTATSSSTATSTTTSPHSTTPVSATATPTPGSDGGDTEKGMKSNTMSIIGGVVGGSLVLLIIIIVAILYVRRRRRGPSATQQYEKSTGYRTGTSSSSSSSHHNARALNISEPIVQQDSYRTDFILKSPSAMSSISNQPVNSRWSGSTNAAGAGALHARTRNLTPSAALRRAQKHLSIPNPFSSPNPSAAASPKPESVASSFDDSHAKTGHVVNSRLAPIRSMRSSRRVSRRTEPQQVRKEASEESINVFADADAVPPLRQQQQQRGRDVHEERDRDRNTTFSDLMDKADLGDVHRGKQRYVPGTTPRL
ncbi:hypothetical protein PWT90_06697 [Aphanocladium album]|nr:hypothetical protein PWT90_06697 [Aphanocladium album]